MDVSPIDLLESAAENPPADEPGAAAAARGRLATRVAIAVALPATFTGVCKVTDDDIAQAMQQVPADRVDDWSYYQPKNAREDVARAAGAERRVTATAYPAGSSAS